VAALIGLALIVWGFPYVYTTVMGLPSSLMTFSGWRNFTFPFIFGLGGVFLVVNAILGRRVWELDRNSLIDKRTFLITLTTKYTNAHFLLMQDDGGEDGSPSWGIWINGEKQKELHRQGFTGSSERKVHEELKGICDFLTEHTGWPCS
jgi:hypothetical protein